MEIEIGLRKKKIFETTKKFNGFISKSNPNGKLEGFINFKI
jgi:hypothetical protein